MNSVHFMSETVEWETPQDFFDKFDAVHKFTLDVCATPDNAKCVRYFTKETDGLSQHWIGSCWMNPPYGRAIGKWVKKAYESSQGGALVVALLPARTDTKWFHDWIYQKNGVNIEFIKGRLKFGGHKGNAPFPSMVVTFQLNS